MKAMSMDEHLSDFDFYGSTKNAQKKLVENDQKIMAFSVRKLVQGSSLLDPNVYCFRSFLASKDAQKVMFGESVSE